MKIENNNNNISFRAKFFHTEALKAVAEYAVEKGKFEKLNQARKNIDCCYLNRRLKFELYTTADEKRTPYAILTRYIPKQDVIVPRTMNDYIMSEPFVFIANKAMNPLKFGYELIIKMSNSAPQNKMFKRVVAGTLK